MTKLTQIQHDLLAAAAARDDGFVEAAAPKTVAALIRRGLLEALPAGDGEPRFAITEAGRAAIQLPESNPQPPPAPAAAPKGKLGALVAMLRRSEGASVEDMMEATGWQAHSVRGAMAGALKKRFGLDISSEKSGNLRVYRIAAEPKA